MRNPFLSALLIALVSSSVQAAGPTGLLNDSGLTQCLNAAGTALEACSEANSGNASTRPGQDGRFGRDPAAANPAASGFTKPAGSGGSGGFAFTPLDESGNAIALTGTPPVPSAIPRCIWDRVTNLIWEVKTDDGGLQDKDWTYGWGTNTYGTGCGSLSPAGCSTNNYITALNAASPSVCPVSGAGAWRLPNRRELLSIVDVGRNSPSIDTAYFPNTASWFYWSSDRYAPFMPFTSAWYVYFYSGVASASNMVDEFAFVRLVRSGP